MTSRSDENAGPVASSDGAEVAIAKLAPISQRARLVTRSLLLDQLDSFRSSRLILVTAPAGYGKSTLLDQWRNRLINRGIKVAWLSLDEDDGNPGDLVTYLAHSLHRAGVPLTLSAVALNVNDDASAKPKLRQILNAIAHDGATTVLMLDEFEHLPPSTIEAIITPLLRWAPENLLISIASRRTPPLPLATLRAQGLLGELQATDLRFSFAEIGELFGSGIPKHEVTEIDRRTEGWPVALQLLRGTNPQSHWEEQQGNIAAYLSEQVFATLPKNLYNFLVESSVLDRLSLGSVERVIGNRDGFTDLTQAEALKPFLTTIDQDVGTYRLHPVLRESLTAAFTFLPRDRQQEINRAAAHWYAQTQLLPRAIRHALEADDHALAGQLIEDAGGLQIWIRHGPARLKAIDDLLFEDLLDQFPRLRLLRTLVLAKDGANAAARRQFEITRQATAAFTKDRDGGNPAILKLEGLMVEATLMMNECRPASDAYLANYEETVSRISGDDHIFQGNVKNLLCLAYHQRGLFERATSASHEAIDHYRQSGLLHGEFYNHLHLGAINMAQGMAETSEASYARAQSISRKHFPDDRAKNALLNILTAELAYEANLLSLAERRLRNTAEQLKQSEGWYDIFAIHYGVHTMLALTHEGLDAALGQLDRGWHLANERHIPGLNNFLTATRISCLTLAGRVDDAADAAQSANLTLKERSHFDGTDRHVTLWRENEAVLLALARLAIRSDQAAEVATVLPPILHRLRPKRQVRSLIRLSVQAAIAFHKLDNQNSAHQHMATALSLSAHSGFQRIYHEEGTLLVPVLKSFLLSKSSNVTTGAHASDILSVIDIGTRARKSFTALSPREVQVLRQLALGLSDKRVAISLNLTENTVKYHLKNIYTKLRVSSRTEAVHIGRQHGLL